MLEYINHPYLFRSNVCYYFFLIFLIQTYEVCDAWKYIASPIDNTPITLPNGDCSIEWIGNSKSNENTMAIKDNNNHWVGLASSQGNWGFYNPNTLSSAPITRDTDIPILITKINGVWKMTIGSTTLTDTGTFDTTTLVIRRNTTKMDNFVIKPL